MDDLFIGGLEYCVELRRPGEGDLAGEEVAYQLHDLGLREGI